MQRLLFVLITLASLAATVSGCFDNSDSNVKTIGIVVPLEHTAMTSIVSGFEQQVQKNYAGKLKFYVKNSQGDMNLQRSIIQQFIAQKVDIIVPIGTTATQMSIQLVKDKPIVSLAAYPDSYLTHKEHGKLITGVLDEIDSTVQINFLQKLYPNINYITLIYSNSEKVIPEVKKIVEIGNERGIKIQKFMLKDLSELYNAAKFIAKDSQAIFILKDHMVVSGIQTLAKIAKERHLPLMTSDEGSVIGGGGFAIALYEKSIGEQGGILAAKILNGENASTLPIHIMQDFTLFYNANACLEQGISIKSLEETAKDLGFNCIKVTPNLP